jgi:hypothetical protein
LGLTYRNLKNVTQANSDYSQAIEFYAREMKNYKDLVKSNKNDYYIINERADDTYENELYYNKINPNGVSDYNDADVFYANHLCDFW